MEKCFKPLYSHRKTTLMRDCPTANTKILVAFNIIMMCAGTQLGKYGLQKYIIRSWLSENVVSLWCFYFRCLSTLIMFTWQVFYSYCIAAHAPFTIQSHIDDQNVCSSTKSRDPACGVSLKMAMVEYDWRFEELKTDPNGLPGVREDTLESWIWYFIMARTSFYTAHCCCSTNTYTADSNMSHGLWKTPQFVLQITRSPQFSLDYWKDIN